VDALQTDWSRKRGLTGRLSRLEGRDVASNQTAITLKFIGKFTGAKAGGKARNVEYATISRLIRSVARVMSGW